MKTEEPDIQKKAESFPINSKSDLEQELKELDASFDYLCKMEGVKDAGHKWIAFSDKWQAFKRKLAGYLAGQQKTGDATGLKKAYDILCGELTALKAGASYKNINGYADAIWDLKIILKDDYGIDVPEFKNWTPSPPTGEPGEDQEGPKDERYKNFGQAM